MISNQTKKRIDHTKQKDGRQKGKYLNLNQQN